MVYTHKSTRHPVDLQIIQMAICLFVDLREILLLEGMRTNSFPRLPYNQ